MRLSPGATITATKSGSNPTFNFDSIPESIVKVGSTYWCVYQGNWDPNGAGIWDVRLASASSPAGPWTAYASNPILTGGVQAWESGADIKIYAPEIMEDSGTFYLFYSACNWLTGVNGKIGVATATTITGPYTKYASNPILSPGSTGLWDSLRVGEPSVCTDGTTWAMAYMGESDAAAFTTSEKVGIATATSPFGPWTKDADNPVLAFGAANAFDDETVADPFLFRDNGYWWMWYTGGNGTGSAGLPWTSGLAYATTPTGTWTKHSSNPILTDGGAGAFDDNAAWRGSVFYESGTYHVVYGALNGAQTAVRGGNATLAVTGTANGPGMWLDFLRDGFDPAGSTSNPNLARMLPQGASAVSDNITSDVISVQINRVADVNGGTPTGTMVVTTKNTGGKYNPDNGSSSVYGNIDPGTPVWFGCNADLTLSGAGQAVYGRFAGYSRTVAPIPAAGATDAPTAEWVFDDAMARYRDAKARVAFSNTRTVATYRTAILTAIGETRTSLATEADTLPATGSVGIGTTILSGARWRRYLTPSNVAPDSLATAREQVRKKPVVTALSVLEDLNKAVGTRHFIAPADTKEDWYGYTTRSRQYKLGAAADAALTAMVTATSGYVHSNDGIVNEISVEARPFRIAPQKVVVWEYPTVPFAIDAGSRKTIVADFGDMVYDATLTVASTNNLTTAALTAYGDGAGIALSSTGPDTVTALYVEGRPVTRLDVVVVEKFDTASQDAHGETQGPNVSSDLITSEGLAEGIASYHIWASKSPRKTPSVTIINNPATLLPLDLHDVVTLTIPQLDVSSKRFEIVGIHETWTRAASASLRMVAFTLDLRQTPNSSALSLFTIGSSTLGGSDGLAP